MKILVLSGANMGKNTALAMRKVEEELKENYGEGNTITFIDLRDKKMEFADGRSYIDYPGDTGEVGQAVMDADIIFVGTPIFQASIPASLKNVFDLIPSKGLEYKTIGIVANAGSNRHYLVPELTLKPILNYLKANVVPRYVYISDLDFGLDEILNDDVNFRLKDLVEETLVLGKTYQQLWEDEQKRLLGL